MKRMMMCVCIVLSLGAMAQTVSPKAVVEKAKKLEVTFNKTTNLVFPSAISSVDRGSQDLLVQKAIGADNVLRVKADVRSFAETNLTVITVDGKLYSFVVNYADQPAELNVTIEEASVPVQHAGLAYADAVVGKHGNVHSVKDKSSGMSAALRGFFVKGDVIFCKLKLFNDSRIDYDIDQFHFYTRDKKKSKRTASQELEIIPLSVTGDTGTFRSKDSRTIVVAIPKLTIPDGKFLAVEITEQNGGRHLFLRAKNRQLMKARKL